MFGHCSVMQYLVSFLILQSYCLGWEKESWFLFFNCLPDVTVSFLWLFLAVPWIGLVVFPDHTQYTKVIIFQESTCI